MKRTCKMCKAEYNVQDSSAFHRFSLCSETCENEAEKQAELEIGGVSMYICYEQLPIRIFTDKKTEKIEMVTESSKWRRDESKTHGLNNVHLENLSGRIEEIAWIEIDEITLEKHFQKI